MSGGGKKKGGGGGGGHGGGWVITFADLMALLMALFVMIVSFSNQDEQKLHDAAGSIRDAFGYQAMAKPAGIIERNGLPVRKFARDTQPVSIADAVEFATTSNDQFEVQGPEVNTNRFEKSAENRPREYLTAAASLRQALEDLPDFAEISKQIMVYQDEDGMHLSIVDQDGRAMFAPQSRYPNERMRVVLGRIAPVIQQMPGRLKIVGHTEATGVPASPGGPAWQLSSDRAVSVAQILGDYGLSPDDLSGVTGVADTDPLFPDDPFLSSNRRVELVLQHEKPPVPGDDLF